MKKAALLTAVAGVVALALLAALVAPDRSSSVLLQNAIAHLQENGRVAVTIAMSNSGGPVSLLDIGSPEAPKAAFTSDAPLVLPGGSTPSLALDGVHVLLSEIDAPLAEGRLIPLTLTFTDGEARTKARLAAPSADPHSGHTMMADGSDMSLSLDVAPDGDGWMVRLTTAGLSFSSDGADGPHVPGQGHGHLYLNGLKLQRLFGSEARIGSLSPGMYDVTVTVNTNDHQVYAVDGSPLAATVRIEAR